MLVPIIISVALVADFLDGWAARILDAKSDIGAQLDSLADMVTFGVLPAVMLYKISSFSIQAYFFTPVLIRYLVFIYTLLACVRLAKFNIDKRQTENFIGLATPAAALFVLGLYGYLFLSVNLDRGLMRLLFHPYAEVVITLILSFLMIAEIPMFSLKGNPFSWKQNKFRVMFFIACIPQVLFMDWLALCTIILSYIFFSVLQNVLEKKQHSQVS